MSVVLSEHLPLLANAPDGIPKLRGLILELAVRGKLVPQDPNDEPASELLKRIAQERVRLEAEGIYKKSKPLAVLSNDEKPYALPAKWAWTRLGEITNFGQTDKDGEITESTWVLDLEDIQKDSSVLLQRVRFAARQAKSDKNRFRSGDVLYGKLRPYLNKVIVADEGGVCTTEILPVRGFSGVVPRFLMYALKRPDFLSYVNSKSYGMKMPRLGTEDGRLAVFPLPPEAEQYRIVAKVDELMALCDRMEAEQAEAETAHVKLVDTLLGTLPQSTDATELAANWQRLAEHFDILFITESSLDALKQTILQLAIMGKLVPQDPNDEPVSMALQELSKLKKALPPVEEQEWLFKIPSNWKWVRIGEIFAGGSGTTPPRARHDYFEQGTEYWVKTTDLNNATVTNCEELITPEAVVNCNLTYYPAGTVCIAMYGGAGTIGKTGVLGINSTINQSVFALPPTSHVSTFFTHYYLKSIRGVWMKFAAGLRVAANINGQIIKNMVFPVPPLAEQNRIVAKVDELMALCDRLKDDLAESRRSQERLASTLIDSALKAA